LDLSKRAGSRLMEADVSYAGVLILRKVCSYLRWTSLMIHIFFSDCPQNTGPLTNPRSAGTGANSAPTGPRQWGGSRETDTWRDREDGRSRDGGWGTNRGTKADRRERSPVDDTYRSRGNRDEGRSDNRKDGDYRDDRRRRSRSPYPSSRRDNDHGRTERRRSRSRERSGDHDYRDKRRRID
jgi:microfibrillar-associated protein 1